MQFEWDAGKAASNRKKHRVTFNEAATVFGDLLAQIFDDPEHSAYEHREIIVGNSLRNRLLMVCFTERAEDIVRIFSARLATRKERQDYEENATT